MSGLSISIVPDVVDERKKRLRGGRFKDHLGTEGFLDEPEPSPSKSPKRLKGVSSRIEKPYFRLTSAPKVSQVRPLSVLKKSLEHVKNKYMEEEDYSYSCEQLKSIRQDLTVQNINNRFTAHVYETHGRIALECGDLCEYNQCQSRLQEMKKKGVTIADEEFNCYRMLHAIYRSNSLELVGILKELCKSWDSDESHELVDFTLELRKAMNTGNDCKFFRLYQNAPHMSGYLIDYMLNPMRIKLYDATIKSYDTVSLPFMMKKLHFLDAQECKEFLDGRHAQYGGASGGSSSAGVTAGVTAVAASSSSSLKAARKEKKKDKKKNKPSQQAVAAIPLETLQINCRESRSVKHTS